MHLAIGMRYACRYAMHAGHSQQAFYAVFGVVCLNIQLYCGSNWRKPILPSSQRGKDKMHELIDGVCIDPARDDNQI